MEVSNAAERKHSVSCGVSINATTSCCSMNFTGMKSYCRTPGIAAVALLPEAEANHGLGQGNQRSIRRRADAVENVGPRLACGRHLKEDFRDPNAVIRCQLPEAA